MEQRHFMLEGVQAWADYGEPTRGWCRRGRSATAGNSNCL